MINNTESIIIAIDAMGGDHGIAVTVPASIAALRLNPKLKIILVGKQDLLQQKLIALDVDLAKTPNIAILDAPEVIAMDENLSTALRGKKRSSMRLALELVRDAKAHACVSAGNTGALMALARFVLKTIADITRPAILFPIPSMKGSVYMLDLGANIDCQAQHLFEFAIMGSVLCKAVENKTRPKVALLNIGSEAIKGTEAVKQAGQMLEERGEINYVGFVEGHDIFSGKVDVVVCDGFVGNAVLKSCEGLAQMLIDSAKQEFTKSIFTKFAALMAQPVLRALHQRFNPHHYNGGSLLGLQGVVIKSHGGANELAFATAIKMAMLEVEKNVPFLINKQLSIVTDDLVGTANVT